MAKIYIAGKVTGLPWEETFTKFRKYKEHLIELGDEPVNPLDLCDKEDSWPVAMGKCIGALLTCTEIHFLPDWKDSKGANLERFIAFHQCISIVDL